MLELINTHRADIQYIVSLLVGLAMLRWGGGPERAIAVMFTGVMMLPLIMFRIWATTGSMMFGSLAPIYVALDVVALAGFVMIALNANRNYPLWIAGFQIVAVGAHLVRGLIDTISPMAYVLLAVGPSYCQLALMLAGLLRHRARCRKFGSYRDWRIGHGLPKLAAMFSGKDAHRAR
jgi:hypothetical protein